MGHAPKMPKHPLLCVVKLQQLLQRKPLYHASKSIKIVFGQGSAPAPTREAYNTLPTLLSAGNEPNPRNIFGISIVALC